MIYEFSPDFDEYARQNPNASSEWIKQLELEHELKHESDEADQKAHDWAIKQFYSTMIKVDRMLFVRRHGAPETWKNLPWEKRDKVYAKLGVTVEDSTYRGVWYSVCKVNGVAV